jgi:hypothetical protein
MARRAIDAGGMTAVPLRAEWSGARSKVTNLLAGRAGLRGGQLLSPTWTLIHLPLHAALSGCKKLLSLVTFFAAAKKVTPPPGRRLLNKKHVLNKKQDKRSSRKAAAGKKKHC